MTQHRVVVHTRALRIQLQIDFDSEPLGRHWATRLHLARVSGSAITIGNVRVPGPEIARIEHGPIGGALLAIADVDALTSAAVDDAARVAHAG